VKKLFILTLLILTGCAITAPIPHRVSQGGATGFRTGTVIKTIDGPTTSVSVKLH